MSVYGVYDIPVYQLKSIASHVQSLFRVQSTVLLSLR